MAQMSNQHARFIAQRAEQREQARVENFHDKVSRALSSANPEHLQLAGVQVHPQRVSLRLPMAVFDGNEHKHISVSFDLRNRGSAPKIFSDNFPGQQINELSIDVPAKLYAVEHRLREENALGGKEYSDTVSQLKAGDGIKGFSRRPNSAPVTLSDGGHEFSLVKDIELTREDASSFKARVSLDIRTDKKGDPEQFIVRVSKSGGVLQSRVLAGSNTFSIPGTNQMFDKGLITEIKAHLKSEFPPKKK